LPLLSVARADAVICMPAGSAEVGVNVAVRVGPSYVTVPAIEPPPVAVSVNCSVAGLIGLLNVALAVDAVDTYSAFCCGATEMTSGGVVVADVNSAST
jgi:hypothetical protein